jgi:hypothetical protein
VKDSTVDQRITSTVLPTQREESFVAQSIRESSIVEIAQIHKDGLSISSTTNPMVGKLLSLYILL